MKKILYLSFYTALIMAVFMGCSSSKSVSTSYKPVQAPADKALVYIYRSSSYAALIAMSVDLDNFQTGNFRTKNYYICLLDPGSHQIIAHAVGSRRPVFIKSFEAILVSHVPFEIIDARKLESERVLVMFEFYFIGIVYLPGQNTRCSRKDDFIGNKQVGEINLGHFGGSNDV